MAFLANRSRCIWHILPLPKGVLVLLTRPYSVNAHARAKGGGEEGRIRSGQTRQVFEATTRSCRDQSDFRSALIGAMHVPRKPQSMHILVWHICMQVSEVVEKS